MTDGLLLDSHILLWLESQLPIDPIARLLIGEAGALGRLFMSDISIWEMGVAAHKKNFERRPNLKDLSVEDWFRKTTSQFKIRQLRISPSIALEAADVPGIYGSGDPGDCFLIATARIRRLSLVTRDSKMIALAKRKPDYLAVTVC
jgi:PIN domain nuclease of toxin-antitoxin system